MSYTDALAQIGQIQAQIAALSNAFAPPAAPATATAAATATSAPATGTTSFADQLVQAQTAVAPASVGLGSRAMPSAGVSTAAAGQLTSGQQQFATTLAADTGLDPNVISAWLLAEENGGAAASRQSANNNDWLNIGYTDAGTYGGSDSIWSNPITAANATAGWLRGQSTVPGYGPASQGIQAILGTAGQPPSAQIAAIQGSGWASGGYPELATLYNEIA
jgi:hypothetical protein